LINPDATRIRSNFWRLSQYNQQIFQWALPKIIRPGRDLNDLGAPNRKILDALTIDFQALLLSTMDNS
jgi:hypothetical protein